MDLLTSSSSSSNSTGSNAPISGSTRQAVRYHSNTCSSSTWHQRKALRCQSRSSRGSSNHLAAALSVP
jgi:hypothetical protein